MQINEFFSRWKEGIKAITPLQMAKVNIFGSLFVFVGIFIGLYTTYKTTWLFIILLGSLILTSISFISTLQKLFAYKEIEDKLKEVKDE